MPTIELEGDTGYYMHDLAALGFGPKVVSKFTSFFPGGKPPANLSLIARDDLTEGQLRYSEILFSGPVIAGLEGGARGRTVRLLREDERARRGGAAGGPAYLRAVADASEVDNAKALVAQAQVLQDHEQAAHEAGTAANLELLRARVQLESQQQVLIVAQNQQAKDLILLKREIGVDPGQEIALTDPVALQRAGDANAGRGASAGLQEPAGLPESAEPGCRV